ncbi:MAG: hypothetical protein K2O40_10625 [Lachnospiraceae bacterium]|nr:hypothetical protein [Lachnospiraceae bacterium]MDE7184902.1 hypothetical protein [Lachnospiraceae bacterium]
MRPLKTYTRIGILFVIITGSIAHFLYDWSNHVSIIGFFTPINESIWEHMKLLFFPMLLYAFVFVFRYKNRYPSVPSALCAGILFGTFLIPFLFYSYTLILGKDSFVLDLGTFILSILIAFWLSYRLALSGRLLRYTPLLCCLVGILFALFLIFTYHPPAMPIFEDPA